MKPRPIDWEQLDRFVSGLGSPQEREQLAAWVTADPELRALADAMRSVGQSPGGGAQKLDTDAAWQNVREQIRGQAFPPLEIVGPANPPVRMSAGRGRRARLPGAIAAALAATIAAVIAHGWVTGRPAAISPQPDVAVASAGRDIVSARGVRSAVTLPDGARVMLGPGSRLRIPNSYRPDSGDRDLHLEGMAHFEVEYDRSRPFRVRTDHGLVEDLGTTFVLTAYPETEGLEVFVSSGRVALHPGAASQLVAGYGVPLPQVLMTLERGDFAHVDTAGTVRLRHGVDVDARTAWVRGTLQFDGESLSDLAPVLERWFDIDIIISDPALDSRRITATFPGLSLTQVLESLSLAMNIEVMRAGRTVWLSSADDR
jgi:transmembrane sensor